MIYADTIRQQAEEAPRAALPAVKAALWRAFTEGHVTETEAEALSALIELRQAKSDRVAYLRAPVSVTSDLSTPDPATLNPTNSGLLSGRQRSPRTSVGSRPRSGASLERRRRWAASGRPPPALAARFTLAEQAALSLIAAETARKGDCRLAIEHVAAIAGVSRSTVKSAIREAKKLNWIEVEERRISGYRNDTNIVRIVSSEWVAWLRLARKEGANRYPLAQDEGTSRYPRARKGKLPENPIQGGGVKSPTRTPTKFLKQRKTRTAEGQQG